ncbi:MAG TPA: galactokinase family protein [Armatimonadota bacterium]|jgi:galactokinase
MWDRLAVSAPGRLCLFGEHQDFLGLSVIACAINLDIQIVATPRGDDQICLDLPDLGEQDCFSAREGREFRHNRDYLPSVVRVLRREGCDFPGLDATVRGTIPINSGTSSSSALVTAWTALLLTAATGEVPEPLTVARLAHRGEVLEFAEPGGMMDHYTSALGGLLYLDCQEPITAERLPAPLDGFVLADSRVRKQTTAMLLRTRVFVKQAVAELQVHFPEFDLRVTPWEEIASFAAGLPEEQRRPLQAQFVNRDLCQEARAMLASGEVDPPRLGKMLLEHQRQLREGVEVSHPKLDELIEVAVQAGALGGKLNGSGGGGAMFAYAPGRQAEVAAALNAAGGKAFIVEPRGGVTVEVG